MKFKGKIKQFIKGYIIEVREKNIEEYVGLEVVRTNIVFSW